jgi:hypothetical protein
MKQRIEKVIHQKHEKSSTAGRKINILLVLDYEQKMAVFLKLMISTSNYCMKFWNELLDKDIDATRMHDIGIRISKNHL